MASLPHVLPRLDDVRLTTDRLLLRPLGPEYAARVLEYQVRNEDHFAHSGPAVTAEFFTVDYQRRRLRSEIEASLQDRSLRLFIFLRDDLHFEHILGDIGLSNIIRGILQQCFLGYKLDREQVGHGYLSEALARAIPFAFQRMALHRIEANIMPSNSRSIRVVERLGFTLEGRSRRYLKINGRWEDHLRYARLCDDPAPEIERAQS